jgi:hypothetical protein
MVGSFNSAELDRAFNTLRSNGWFSVTLARY